MDSWLEKNIDERANNWEKRKAEEEGVGHQERLGYHPWHKPGPQVLTAKLAPQKPVSNITLPSD